MDQDYPARQSIASTEEEQALVQAISLDRRNFGALYERYATSLYRYALHQTGSPQEAEDLVSSTMLAALEAWNRFDPSRGSLAGWLFGIARHKLAQHRRLRRRLERLLRHVVRVSGQASVDNPGPETEDILALREALHHLAPNDQEVIVLRYGAGLSTREIADALAISEAAVRVRLTRARHRLKRELGGE